MANATAFVRHHARYEQWFEQHTAAYVSELLALRSIVPAQGRGLEIGVGTARFAAPLGVGFGVDPAIEMLAYAASRGVSAVGGTAEALPFGDGVFDYVLVVTTICFVASPPAMLDEARRVLRPDGELIIGFIDRASAIGQSYQERRDRSVFYRDATFYSASEIEALLRGAGFAVRQWAQTLCGVSPAVQEIEPVRQGTGRGAFAVVRAGVGADRTRKAAGPSASVVHHAGNCRWAAPTLLLPAPYWWNAEDCPWACVREAVPSVLETTEVCAHCPRWEALTHARTPD
jgi:hypothetical protein